MIVDSAISTNPMGLLYLDKGIAVLDAWRMYDTGSVITGKIKAVTTTGTPVGTEVFAGTLPRLMFSASMDDLLDHLCSTRFASTADTAICFQNNTIINSSMFFCNLGADEFNYSSNPTYIDSTNRIVVIDVGQEESQRSFTFITSVGLYDANNNLLAVAKLSRPIYKDAARSLTIKCRVDY
jgi:hypothetical protein